ncbi:MAG: sulfatase-like hydrolase/transferase [Actinobacteria bacterium]|nr:sulfatase-like hydrolase/transferase [Actinomycetota bacterium]
MILLRIFAVLVACALVTACTGNDETPDEDLRRASGETDPCAEASQLVELTRRGYFPGRSPEIALIPRAPNFIGASTNPPHTGPWPFLTNVPLVLYGPGFVRDQGRISTPSEMADLAPTTARLIGFDEWSRREGRVLTESLLETGQPPRLVVSIVWDGAGWNALDAHSDKWPFLGSLMESGTTYTNFNVGSNPSVTPPVHASLGTGAYPDTHGITGVSQRAKGTTLVDPWAQFDSKRLRIDTLADLYDISLDNQPLTGMVARVNWHLGMIGHGAAASGGDRDEVLLLRNTGEAQGNEVDYASPPVTEPGLLESFAADLDAEDGEIDGQWRGRPLDEPGVRGNSPAFTRYQGVMLRRVIDRMGFGSDEVPDLLYVNMKETDLSYHAWGMDSPEVGDAMRAQDEELRKLTMHLDEQVGAGRWVVMLTADHGLVPDPERSGAFPIKGQEVLADINAEFDRVDNDVDLAYHLTAYGAYIDEGERARNDVSREDIGRWLAGYTLGENVPDGQELADTWEGRESERLFSAVMSSAERVDPCRREE